MANLIIRPKPVVLLIADGVGVAPDNPGNAVTLAKTPNLDLLWPKFPHTYLYAAGINVGLPHGVDGNSEVGHMNLGAGKIIFQELPRIDNAINTGQFNENEYIKEAFRKTESNKVHIMGLIGTGQVHASYGHLLALIEMARKENANGDKVFLHLFTDGRDSSPKGAFDLLGKLEQELQRFRVGRIATIIGRYYGMDRDERWERTKKAYDLIVDGKGKQVEDWRDALKESYESNIYDEYIKPYVVTVNGKINSQVEQGDSILFFNYRPDRAVQITRAFEEEKFPGWEREIKKDIYFVGMSNYEKGFPRKVAFPPELIDSPLGKIISDHNLKQLRIAESEKFPHVSYFLNGRNQVQQPGEDWIEVPSPQDIATYDEKPEMSAFEVTDIVLKKIKEQFYDVIIVNYANADMVAHTGVTDATVKAMEITDDCIGKIVVETLKVNGVVLITSDHGNAEEMVNPQNGQVDTKHSTNPVPFIIVKKDLAARELSFGILADVAPTMLYLLGIHKPETMTGKNLLL